MDAKSIEAQAAIKRLAAGKLAPIDPYYFFDFLYTHDEHDPDFPRKPFKKDAILRLCCRFWMENWLMFTEKSRQIKMTWTMCGLTLWDALHQPNRRHFVRSKKQEDAEAVLDRIKFLIEGLIEYDYPNLPKIKMTADRIGTSDEIHFPELNSYITAIPQGAGQTASYTVSGLFDDEINLQDKAQEGYEIALPTVKGGGRYSAVGTPNGHTFGWRTMYSIDEVTEKPTGKNKIDSKKYAPLFVAPDNGDEEWRRRWLEHHLMTMPDETFRKIPIEKLAASMPGVKYWRTQSGVDVLSLHYSADPEKSPETKAGRLWKEREEIGYTKDMWDRQYEICYETSAGRPVISNWSKEAFVTDPEYDFTATLYLSIDFGKKCGCIFFQYLPVGMSDFKQVRVLDEVYLENANTYALRDAILAKLNNQYQRSWRSNNVRGFCDPAGNQTRETTAESSLNTSIKILRAAGIRLSSKKVSVREGTLHTEAVFAMSSPHGEPAVAIHSRCTYLISCVAGGWKYPPLDKKGQKEGHPIKDGKFEHGGDMIKYGICNLIRPEQRSGVPRPMQKRIAIKCPVTNRILRYKTIGPVNRGARHAVRGI